MTAAKNYLATKGPATKSKLREVIKANTKDIGIVIDALLEAGDIEAAEVQVSNHRKPIDGFALTAEEAQRQESRNNFAEALATYNGGTNGDF
jgi:hypothetical protein